jgi:hypothetical protein
MGIFGASESLRGHAGDVSFAGCRADGIRRESGAAKQEDDESTGCVAQRLWKKRRKAFGIVAVLEVVGCIIVLALVGVFRRPDWAAAGISLIVGLHFLPLARIFESTAYYWVGSLMVAWDIVTVTVLKSWNPTVSADIASGAILWAAAIHTLMRSFWVASPERSF